MIAPHARRTTRKTTQRGDAISSHYDEEAANPLNIVFLPGCPSSKRRKG
jgi:hypothetical protein